MKIKFRDKEYSVSISSLDEGGYMATVDELDGCYSVGETLNEIEGNLPDALQSYIGALEKSRSQKEIDGFLARNRLNKPNSQYYNSEELEKKLNI